MNNFEELQFPNYAGQLTHYLNKEDIFLEVQRDQLLLDGTINTINSRRLPKDAKVLVLEERLGINALWNLVRLEDESEGYVLNESLSPLQNTKPSFPCTTDLNYQPKPYAIEVDWRKEKPNSVYLDSYNGKLGVHVELPYQKINGKEDLRQKIKEAYTLGVTIILDFLGKNNEENYIENITNNYYIFARAEEYYFPLRECSTLRVLVTIPLRYIFSNTLENKVSTNQQNKLNLNNVFGLPNLSDEVLETLLNDDIFVDDQRDIAIDPEEQKYKTIEFLNYSKFSNFIKALLYDLGQQQLILASGQWIIEPEGINLNLLTEISNVKIFEQKINTFINSNITSNNNAGTTYFNALINPFDNGGQWNGKLKFYVDTENLTILDIMFYDNLDERIPLNSGYYNTLDDETIKNKTIVNYLLNQQRSSVIENIGRDIADKVGQIGNVITSSADSVNNAASNINISSDVTGAFNAAADTALNAAQAARQALSQLNPDEGLKKFLLENHYPKITNIIRQPIDLGKCIQPNISLIADLSRNYKNPALVRQLSQARKQAQTEQAKLEGDLLQQMQSSDIKNTVDPALRKLFGIDPFANNPQKEPVKFINEVLEVANLIDIQRILLEGIKCQIQDLDPQTFNELMSKYQNVKKELDSLMNISLCNPYATNTLKIFSSFQIPVIPVQNRNRSLTESLTKLLVQIINDAIVLLVRKLLTNSFKSCIDDVRRSDGPNILGNNIDPNSIDPNAGINDPAITDLLDDLYGGIYDENGNIDPEALQAAKEKIKNLLDDLSNCLSPRELCSLLRGEAVSDEVTDSIKSFIKIKYPDLYLKFNNKESIVNFFYTLGSNIGDDLTICNDILTAPDTGTSVNCDDGTIKTLRDALLSDKGLTDDLIEDLLNDINDKKAKELEDLLKFLDSDDPIDFNNIPSVLCKNGVPPAISVSPTINSFKNLVNTLFNDIYNAFDDEAAEWYKTTYSVSSSAPLTVKYDDEGNIVSAAEADSNQQSTAAASGSQDIFINYIFNESINNINSSVVAENEDYKYSSHNINLDGKKQQELDIVFVDERLKKDITIAEKSLRLFLGKFKDLYTAFLAVTTVQAGLDIADAIVQQQNITNQDAISRISNFATTAFGGRFGTDFSRFLKAQDLFLMNNLVDIKESGRNDLASNSLIMAENGIPVYLTVVQFLENNKSNLQSLIDLMLNKLKPSSTQTFIDGGNINSSSEFKQVLNNAIRDYNDVRKSYEVILNSKIKYPSYTIKYDDGIKKYFSLENYDNENIYDISRIIINKNSNNYLRIGTRTKINNELSFYILNVLKNNKNNLNKRSILNSYIKHKKQTFNETLEEIDLIETFNEDDIFSSLENISLNTIKEKIINKDNLFNNYRTIAIRDSSVKQPYTRYFGDKLIIKQTPAQKACGVRPHYLDIDGIKNSIVENKEKSLCSIEEVKDESLISDTPINSSNLQKIETSSTQNILSNGVYQLAIRTYLHDILLRGINLFSYFDPQSLRNEQNFIDFMAYLVESEMRGVDNTFFNLMINHFSKMANLTSTKTEESLAFLQRDMFRDTVEQELKNNVLPKLAKRIWEDTNAHLASLNINSKIHLHNAFDEYIKNNKIIFETNSSVYLRTGAKKAIKISDGNLQSFKSSIEYDLLFDYLFSQTKHLNFYFMMSVLSTSTRRSVVDSFKNTKSTIRKLGMITQTNGANITPDLSNMQDIVNNDDDEIIRKFIFDSLIKAPYLIFKGFAEMSEPNLLVSSGIYKVLSSFVPDTPSFTIPISSGALAFVIPPVNPIVYVLYLAGLFWYEDKSNNNEKAQKSMLLAALQSNDTAFDCEQIQQDNPDLITLNQEGVYETK